VQIRSQFEYEICTGHFSPGDKLPSVREVAGALGVSPVTVSRAYRDLEVAGLVVAQPGVGFFVLTTDESYAGPHAEIRGRAAKFLEDAVAEGVSLDQTLQILLAEVGEMRARLANVNVVLVCKRMGRAAEIVSGLRQAFSGMRVEVSSLVLEEVIEDVEGWLPTLSKARHVLCLVFDLRQIQPLLARHGITVTPILGMPREDVRRRLVDLEPGCRVGIVASAPEFVDGMIAGVTEINPDVTVVGGVSCDNTDQLAILLSSVDCVIYGSLAREVVDALALPSHAIELVYVPETRWIERFRIRLRNELGT
jgi:GntR family transcriptional regulator